MSEIAIVPNAKPRKSHPERQAAVDHGPPAYRGDVAIYRMVVVILGAVLMASTGGALVCEISEKRIPEFLIALGSGAFGALGGLLAPSPLPTGR